MYAEPLFISPRVVFHRDVITADMAQDIIDAALPRLSPALLSGDANGLSGDGRRADAAWIPHNLNSSTQRTVDLVSDLVGISALRAEQLHVIRYREGGEYKAHLDSYDLNTERGRRCTKMRGQRIFTALLYLNDSFLGGETAFPNISLLVAPRAGSVLIFDNCLKDSLIPDPKSLHCGQPVQVGEKWLATLWYRER
ncbi:prolyl hydroxylase family protein [Chromobacterium subtsugae]|uniref:prolyl hydroxylase family protein n=1 Tax=Chromobacterium subtsugae TaxID=251747 RepID=UPI0006410654|nr:2OG-Fe(II) oxygenase [Chromobacterium subtsugae]